MLDAKISQLVADYGVEVKAKLAGAGEPEEALRVPIEHLITAVGAFGGKKTILDGEAHLTELSSRPDFAVRVKGAVVGYIEVKKAGLSLDPSTFSGHNRDQWNRLKDLPNLIYTNGSEWRLYRGEPQPALVAQLAGGPLDVAGAALAPDSNFAHLVADFLNWHPIPIKTVPKLVSTIAPITRMLRTKVIEQLALETARVKAGAPKHEQLFLGLANDWRSLLFPDASDEVFADGYAQTVTFALLLARTEKIELESTSLYEIGQQLGADHSLMGKALQLLTNDVKGDFVPTIDLLRRVIGAVQWDAVRKNKDTYLHLSEGTERQSRFRLGGPRHHCTRDLSPAAALFHSLSDETRLAIVQHLAAGEARVTDLVRRVGLAQSTVSAHIACLRDCGLVHGRAEGRQVFYSLSRPELLDLLLAAEGLLAATGSRVDLCSVYGRRDVVR